MVRNNTKIWHIQKYIFIHLSSVHVEVSQGREDLYEASLPLCGAFGDSQHPKHFAALHTVNITDVWEVEGVLENGGLNSEEVHLQPAIFFQGKHLAHKVDQLLGPLPLVGELHEDKVVNLEK